MTQVITQAAIEAMKGVDQAMLEVADPLKGNNSATSNMSTRNSGPALKQLFFNWKVQGKYNDLFELEIM